MESHGTPSSFTVGQFATVSSRITRALPKALSLCGLDPKTVILHTDGGERLSRSLAEALKMLYNGHAAVAATDSLFVHDKRKEGWGIVKNCGFIPALTSAANLELVPFLKGESYVNSETMATRAVEQSAALGQKHAEYLLEHQKDIPEEFRKFYLVFPGTIWRDSDCGCHVVPYLRWFGVGWCLDWSWLDYVRWDGSARLLRPRR